MSSSSSRLRKKQKQSSLPIQQPSLTDTRTISTMANNDNTMNPILSSLDETINDINETKQKLIQIDDILNDLNVTSTSSNDDNQQQQQQQ